MSTKNKNYLLTKGIKYAILISVTITIINSSKNNKPVPDARHPERNLNNEKEKENIDYEEMGMYSMRLCS